MTSCGFIRVMVATIAVVAAILRPETASAADSSRTWTDLAGDVLVRRTDPQMVAELAEGCNLPNLTRLMVGTWSTPTPTTDPYTGTYVDAAVGHLLRFDLELRGVVNPPGSLSQSSYTPFQFGPSPLYGFIEFDVDGDVDTGGELGSAARNRYLANVGRFGRLPRPPLTGRAAKFGWQVDSIFGTTPQIERSGSDFSLAFCGCYPTTIVSESGNGNGVFEAGETWIVRGGFFQRAGGYQGACSSIGGAAGLQVGQYVPWVNLRWSHSIATDRTTITLIFPATMQGAAQLAGQAVQPMNFSASDHTSLAEALNDLITGCGSVAPGTPVHTLSNRWSGRDPNDPRYRDPTRWSTHALVGTAAVTPVDGASLIWTDTGFDDVHRDLNGDGIADPSDKSVVLQTIEALDGSVWDAGGNGREDGVVILSSPGVNFAAADVDGNGSIDSLDVRSLCIGDFNRDGQVNILDYITFFNAFITGDSAADLNLNGVLDAGDFSIFTNSVLQGC